MSEQIRSFIAFDMENEQVLNRLAAAQKLLVETGADLRPVAPQNIHITTRFLGDISPGMVDKIYEAMKNVKFTPFNIQASRFRRFSQPQLSSCCLGGNDRWRRTAQKHFHSVGTSDSRFRVCGGCLRVQPTLNHCTGKVWHKQAAPS